MEKFKRKKAIILTVILSIFAVPLCAQLNAGMMNEKVMRPAFIKESVTKKPPYKVGVGAEIYVSGNAHGTFYSLQLNVSKGKSVFGIGPCLQKRSMDINGAKISYSRLLSGCCPDRYEEDELAELKNAPEDILELRALCYVQYTREGQLSYKASRVETITHGETGMNYSNFRTSTIEAALCAELDINLNKLRIRNYVGFTMYYHFDYTKDMYRPKSSPALVFGTGFVIPNF